MTCLSCTSPKYAKKLCRYHYYLANPLKRTPLLRKPGKVKKVSKKLAKMKTVYGHIRKDFLDEHEYCEVQLPNCCTGLATDIHHKAGREGARLNDVTLFLACCRNCHDFIERHPTWAKASGFSVSRLDKAS